MEGDKEIAALTERVAKIEGILEQINTRLNHLEARLDHIEAEMRTNYRWIMGTIITMWVTVIMAILLR